MKKLVFVLLILGVGFVFGQSSAIIADGATTSSKVDLNNSQKVGVEKLFTFKVPSSFDGATITIYTSPDTVTANFYSVYDEDDAALTFSVTAGRTYRLRPSDYYYIERYVYFGTDVAATGADTIEVNKGNYNKQ